MNNTLRRPHLEREMASQNDVEERILEIFRENLDHGFFECNISCEKINGKCLKLVVTDGKSYKFNIPEGGINR